MSEFGSDSEASGRGNRLCSPLLYNDRLGDGKNYWGSAMCEDGPLRNLSAAGQSAVLPGGRTRPTLPAAG